MTQPTYAGIPQPEVLRRIAQRGRLLRMPRCQVQDAQQEILTALKDVAFDPAHALGATPLTFLTSIIDHKLRSNRRATLRQSRRCRPLDDQDAGEAVGVPALLAPAEPTELKIDVHDAIALLSPRRQQVCRGLGEGKSVLEIARELGCCRDTVVLDIAKVRLAFGAIGLAAWVQAH